MTALSITSASRSAPRESRAPASRARRAARASQAVRASRSLASRFRPPASAARRSRSSRQPRPRSAIDLGDQRAEPAVDVVRLDGQRGRHPAEQLGDLLDRRRVERRGDATVASMPLAASSSAAAQRPRGRSRPIDQDAASPPSRDRARGARARSVRRGPGTRERRPCRSGSRPGRAAIRCVAAPRAPASASAGAIDRHPGLRAHHRDVLEREVGDARCGRSRSRRRRRRCAPAARAATGPLRMNS